MTEDDGYCHCPEPLTDEDVGADEIEGDGDDLDAFCWRCQRPVNDNRPSSAEPRR